MLSREESVDPANLDSLQLPQPERQDSGDRARDPKGNVPAAQVESPPQEFFHGSAILLGRVVSAGKLEWRDGMDESDVGLRRMRFGLANVEVHATRDQAGVAAALAAAEALRELAVRQ